MSSDSQLNYFDLWSYVILFIAVSSVLCLYMSRLCPTYQSRRLVHSLEETENLYHYALEEGFLSGDQGVHTATLLKQIRANVNRVSLQSLQATTFREEARNVVSGLTGDIHRLLKDVNAVRARICAASYVALRKVELQTGWKGRKPAW